MTRNPVSSATQLPTPAGISQPGGTGRRFAVRQATLAGMACSIGVIGAFAPGVTGRASAQTWSEIGDAGQNGVGAAQHTYGTGPLTQIVGVLDGNNDVDLFCICIKDYANFRAEVTIFGLFPVGNSMLWLFNPDGTLQVWNDDFLFASELSTITSQGVANNGDHYIGISSFLNLPLDPSSSQIRTGGLWSGPDPWQGKGNGHALDHWSGGGGDDGLYVIELTGAVFCPTPGATAILGCAGVLAGRRRRCVI
jgi:hypothetical protein